MANCAGHTLENLSLFDDKPKSAFIVKRVDSHKDHTLWIVDCGTTADPDLCAAVRDSIQDAGLEQER